MKKAPLTVILPTLNEAENITLLIEKLISSINPEKIIIVDDNSADGTGQIAGELSYRFKEVKAVINDPPAGLTASIQQGIQMSSSNYVAWMDADFSHPPQILKQMLAIMTTADLAIGSWLADSGRDERKELMAKYMSLIINRLCQFLFGKKITAYTSGFIMAKRDILKDFKLTGNYGEYCIDLLVKKAAEGVRIIEVPIICISRIKGNSKTMPNPLIYILRGYQYLKTIIKLKMSLNE